MTTTMTTAPPQIDFETRVDQYVKLRDKVKEIKERHEQELEPFEDALETLEGMLLEHLNAIGADKVSSAGGTVYRTTKTSASIADGDAFWRFCVDKGEYDLIDKRANKTAVLAYIEEHGVPVPGVNVSSMHTVGVRRPVKK